jgi:hypothetical protein
MRDPFDRPSLMSQAQLDSFRAQLGVRHEAAFLAPQLLEQVMILTRDLRIALGDLETLRVGMASIAKALSDLLGTAEARPIRRELAAVLDRVRALAAP